MLNPSTPADPMAPLLPTAAARRADPSSSLPAALLHLAHRQSSESEPATPFAMDGADSSSDEPSCVPLCPLPPHFPCTES